eukprot:125351-Rhodomonas_salina.1
MVRAALSCSSLSSPSRLASSRSSPTRSPCSRANTRPCPLLSPPSSSLRAGGARGDDVEEK